MDAKYQLIDKHTGNLICEFSDYAIKDVYLEGMTIQPIGIEYDSPAAQPDKEKQEVNRAIADKLASQADLIKFNYQQIERMLEYLALEPVTL